MEADQIVKQGSQIAYKTSQDAEQFRKQLHGMWSGVAPAWGEHAVFIDARGKTITEQMLARSNPQSGDHVLELACGPGSVGLAAATRVGAKGRVVLSDVAVEMTSIAAKRAEALGLGNVEAFQLDLENIAQPDASFDVVLCREGLMLVPDPLRALREIKRVLRPGGRLALAVWGPRQRNPWLGVIFDTVTAQTGVQTPPPGVPHPFSLDDANRLASLMKEAGLSDISVTEVSVPYHDASAEEWWERCCALAGPLAQKLATMPDQARDALRKRGCEAIETHLRKTQNGIEIPGVSLLATASKA